jgi:alpha 1,3-glucosidase
MNEPAIRGTMEGTFPKDARHINGLEARETHSLYGLLQTASTFKGLLTRDSHIGQAVKRPFVLTRSHYAGSQKYAFTWTGDNGVDWGQLRFSISMILVSGLNSMPFIGEDVGGFLGKLTEQLAVRWFQLGAWVYPFYRSHNCIGVPRKEPWMFPEPTCSRLTRALKDRYMLMGVWYTQSVYATRRGRGPVVPLWYDWPEVDAFHDNEREVILGESLLVVPVVEENAGSVEIVKPPGYWYDLYTGQILKESMNRSVTLDEVPVYVRGGRIVPLYNSSTAETALTTIVTPLTLVIGLNEKNESEGSLYLDDGVSYDFESGKFVHRNFTFENKVLKWFKACEYGKEVPEFLRSAIVSFISIYYVLPDGSSRTDHISDLNLKVSEEWSWSWPKGLDSEHIGESKSYLTLILSVFGGVVIIVCVVGMVIMRGMRGNSVGVNPERLLS